MKVFIDTETCGLHSACVLIQYAFDDGPIQLHDVWLRPVGETLDLIESFLECDVVGFNLAFDWFHLQRLHATWSLLPRDWIPICFRGPISCKEPLATYGDFIKPERACDLMLHARTGPYQALMKQSAVRVRKVPSVLAPLLQQELERRVNVDGIYFAGRKKDGPQWQIQDTDDPHFKNVNLIFHPKGGLKFLAEYALKKKPHSLHSEIGVPDEYQPEEYGYAPLNCNWRDVIEKHVMHWHESKDARRYAYDDIVYTRELYEHFGSPEPGDNDSELAVMVGCCRWRGYSIDTDRLAELRTEAQRVVDRSPVNTNAPNEVRAYIDEVLSTEERLLTELHETTNKATLKAIVNQFTGEGARRAQEILDIKSAFKEVELYDKLLFAGRFHPSFVVVGTKSNRMSGAGGGLNPQGVKRTKEVRKCFKLADEGYKLCGGDFDSFEVTLADAVYQDEGMHNDLVNKVKIHAYMGMYLNPGSTFEEVLASDGTDNDMYTQGKMAVFAMMYGGDAGTLVRNSGVAGGVAEEAERQWLKRYPGIAESRKRVEDAHKCLQQLGGIGSKVEWVEPSQFVESFLGFRRYFTLEYSICRELFKLAQDTPKQWRNIPVRVRRRDRVQTAAGAVSSALYAAAFGLSSSVVRAAVNHEIQSPGGQITKDVQSALWSIQPVGVNPPVVMPLNVHDEIECVTAPDKVDAVTAAVRERVESYRDRVPLIGMTWCDDMENWAEKKGGEIKISPQSSLSDFGNIDTHFEEVISI